MTERAGGRRCGSRRWSGAGRERAASGRVRASGGGPGLHFAGVRGNVVGTGMSGISRSLSMVLLLALGCDASSEAGGTEPLVAAEPAPEPTPTKDATPEPPTEVDGGSEARRAPDSPEPRLAPPSSAATLELTSLGLRARAPAGTEAVPSRVEGATLVRGPELFAVVLEADERPATVEVAKTRARRVASRSPRTEILDDGWLLTVDGSNELGPVLVLQVRREIGGRAVWCESVVASASQREAAAALCRSLEPA